jgi:hypothetical protein
MRISWLLGCIVCIGFVLAISDVAHAASSNGSQQPEVYSSQSKSLGTLKGGVQQNVGSVDPFQCFWNAWRSVQNAVQAYQLALGGGLNASFACHITGQFSSLEPCWARLQRAKSEIEQAAPMYERARFTPGQAGIQLNQRANDVDRQAAVDLKKADICYEPIAEQRSDKYSSNRSGNPTPTPTPYPRPPGPGPIPSPYHPNASQNYGPYYPNQACTEDSAHGLIKGPLLVSADKIIPQQFTLVLDQHNSRPLGTNMDFQITNATIFHMPRPASNEVEVHFACGSSAVTEIFFHPATQWSGTLLTKREDQTPTPCSDGQPAQQNPLGEWLCPAAEAQGTHSQSTQSQPKQNQSAQKQSQSNPSNNLNALLPGVYDAYKGAYHQGDTPTRVIQISQYRLTVFKNGVLQGAASMYVKGRDRDGRQIYGFAQSNQMLTSRRLPGPAAIVLYDVIWYVPGQQMSIETWQLR